MYRIWRGVHKAAAMQDELSCPILSTIFKPLFFCTAPHSLGVSEGSKITLLAPSGVFHLYRDRGAIQAICIV